MSRVAAWVGAVLVGCACLAGRPAAAQTLRGTELGSLTMAGPVAVSADGSVAVVGAPRDGGGAGAAGVWTRSGATWTMAATLAGGGPGLAFGSAAALSADGARIVVGAPATSVESGTVRVLDRSGATWSETGVLSVPGSTAAGGFGEHVAISADGGTVLVAAPFEGDGVVHVFVEDAGGWSEEAVLSPPRPMRPFGTAVALSADGSTAVIGWTGDGIVGTGLIGASVVFTRSGAVWTEDTTLHGTGVSDDQFGDAVAVSGDGSVVLVGAWAAGAAFAGTARVFERSGATWVESTLATFATADEDDFGRSVALSDDGRVALVAVPFGAPANAGYGALFVRSLAGWQEQPALRITPGSGRGDTLVGSARFVALSGDGTTAVLAGETTAARVFMLATGDDWGTPCVSGADCAAGRCVDGVCCESACGDGAADCQGCSVLALAPVDGRCFVYGAGFWCADPSCVDGRVTMAVCDGASGACPPVAETSCAPYLCSDSTSCGLACSSPGDCVDGAACLSGSCVLPDAGAADVGIPDAGLDGGAGVDAGSGPGPMGCGCAASGSRSGAAALWLALLFALCRSRARVLRGASARHARR